ncbi:MFS general substrate transporter [Mycena leptocephala]|nr:MFS general substrate transporter [Mycena leptocephala]
MLSPMRAHIYTVVRAIRHLSTLAPPHSAMPELSSELPSLARKSPEISRQGLHPDLSNHDLDKKESDADVEVQPSASSPINVDEFPDGGFRAWAVVFGVYFLSSTRVSVQQIFQVYYQQTILRHSSPSQIAWIGSVQRCMVFIPGVFVGRLFDLGFFRVTFVTGSLLIIAGTFLIPVCKVYWHLLLCQGFMIGVGFGLTYRPSATVITHWWKRRRGFAFGVAASGSAVGGVFFPIFVREALPIAGFTYTLRIMGFISIFTFSMANLCLVRRLPPHNAEGGLFGLHVFRNAAFTVFSVSWFLTALGSFTVGAYLTTSAVSHDLSLNFAFYLVAIHNGASFLGAVLFGLYGDLIGAMNALIQGITAIGVITVVWPFCGTVASLSVIAILYGFSIGAFSALAPVPIAAMGGTEDLGRRLGIINTVLGLGTLCGPPLAGLFLGTSLGYKAVGYYSGGMVFLGMIFFALARYLAVPRLRAKF